MTGFRYCLFIAALWLCMALCQAANAATAAVIGTGDMGDSLGPRLAELGYTVVYGSRDPSSERVRELVAATGHGASAAPAKAAVAKAELVVLAVPWPAMETVARNLGKLDGKIVIDVSMPFTQGEDGYPAHLLEKSSAELIQGWNPGAMVVKAFATMGSQIIDDPDEAGGIVSIPIASDYKSAKEKVAAIVADMGLDPVDFGPLRMAREIEALQLIYMIPLVQNRPENWEFHFLRSEYYGCYRSHGDTTEGVTPPYDADNLATFPSAGDERPPCPEHLPASDDPAH